MTILRFCIWVWRLAVELLSFKEVNIVWLDLVLESRTSTIFIPGKKYGEDADQQVTLPIQTSFWSFVDVDSSSKKHIQKDNSLIGQMVRHVLCYGNNCTIVDGSCCFSL